MKSNTKAKETGRKGKRKAAAAAVDVPPEVDEEELIEFAGHVEIDVDGWRCVDLDAFARQVEEHSKDDPLILRYVHKLQTRMLLIDGGWLYGAELISHTLEWWRAYGDRGKEIVGDFCRLHARATKTNEHWLALQKNHMTSLGGMIRHYCEEGLDCALHVPMMAKGESGARILNLDSLLPGAADVGDMARPAFECLAGGLTARRMFDLITDWTVALIDELHKIENTLKYDRLAAAIADVEGFLEGLPGMFAGRMLPHGDLEARVSEARQKMEKVRREIAAGMVAAGGAKRQGVKVGKLHDTSIETKETEQRLFKVWDDYVATGRKTYEGFIRDLEEGNDDESLTALDMAANDKEKRCKDRTSRRVATLQRLIGRVNKRNSRSG